jgi:hypothetical protein
MSYFGKAGVKDLTAILFPHTKLIWKIHLPLFSNAGRDNTILTEPIEATQTAKNAATPTSRVHAVSGGDCFTALAQCVK